jgi:hypothetical protein
MQSVRANGANQPQQWRRLLQLGYLPGPQARPYRLRVKNCRCVTPRDEVGYDETLKSVLVAKQ